MASARVLVTDPGRRLLRKAKLWLRETLWVTNNSPDGLMVCPCSLCERGRKKKFTIGHCANMIETYGRHETCWGSSEGYEADDSDDEWDSHIANTCGAVRPLQNDEHYDYSEMESMVMDALNQHEAFHGNFPAHEATRDFLETEEGLDWDNMVEVDGFWQQYVEAMESARTPLYHKSTLQQLTSLVMFLSIFEAHDAPDALTSEVMAFLSMRMLPQPNTMPSSTYEASKILGKLGLGYRSYHACPNGCILYRGEQYKDLQQCPRCRASRLKPFGKSQVPRLVVRHFPTIPRIKRMFACALQAELMTWHERNRSTDGKVRMAADSYQWRWINWRWRAFGQMAHNLRFGLCSDGINPNSEKRSTYSLWPVVLLNYNIEPWLTMSKEFIMLTMLMPGPRSVTGRTFNVYIQPVVDEFLELWEEGVVVRDASMQTGEQLKLVKAMLIWCVHDYPAYGMISGLVSKGYQGCVCCGPQTKSRRSRHLKKNVYDDQHRRHLNEDHELRRNTVDFRGREEHATRPVELTGDEILRCGQERESFLRHGRTLEMAADPVHKHGVKRVSALFQLPYWKELPVRHTLDVMHIERNVCHSLLLYLFGDKDTVAMRKDLEEVGAMPGLHLVPQITSHVFMKPHAPFVLQPDERVRFLNTISSVKTPSLYSSSFTRQVGNKKLSGLKSHDYHILMQELLPACLRTALHPDVRCLIIRLCSTFKRICAKDFTAQEFQELDDYVAEVMAMAEVWLPPSFFDLMTHLVVHIPRQLAICGPVHCRWMYGTERYMGVLKSFCHSRNRPEASICNGFLKDETMDFVAQYLPGFQPSARKLWFMEEDKRVSGEIPERNPRSTVTSEAEIMQLHKFVISHSVPTAALFREYKVLQDEHDERERRRSRQRSFSPFAPWLESRVKDMLQTDPDSVSPDLVNLATLPSRRIREYDTLWAYGSHYRCVIENEHNSFVSFDSGVVAKFRTWCRSSTRDRHPVEADLKYVGIVRRIIEVQYGDTPCLVLQCSWIRPNLEGIPTMKKDSNGIWLVKYWARQQPEREPYVFPFNVPQVYFVSDKDPQWSIVIEAQCRSRRVFQGAANDSEDHADILEDGIEVEEEPVPVSPPPAGEAVPVEEVHALVADMEDPNDRQHVYDNEYPDVDEDEEPHDTVERGIPVP